MTKSWMPKIIIPMFRGPEMIGLKTPNSATFPFALAAFSLRTWGHDPLRGYYTCEECQRVGKEWSTGTAPMGETFPAYLPKQMSVHCKQEHMK